MPPPTIPRGVSAGIDAQIQDLIDRLGQFGNTFDDLISDLRDLQNKF